MHPQLQSVIREFEAAQRRLHSIVESARSDNLVRRAAPDSWSPAECIEHLNLTSQAFLPLLRDGLTRARQLGTTVSGNYRRDFAGWLLSKVLGPPVRFRTRTSQPFIPKKPESVDDIVREFDRLQAELMAIVREAAGLPLDRVKLVSPFDSRVKYNLYSTLIIIPLHQHRHLWQAEKALHAT